MSMKFVLTDVNVNDCTVAFTCLQTAMIFTPNSPFPKGTQLLSLFHLRPPFLGRATLLYHQTKRALPTVSPSPCWTRNEGLGSHRGVGLPRIQRHAEVIIIKVQFSLVYNILPYFIIFYCKKTQKKRDHDKTPDKTYSMGPSSRPLFVQRYYFSSHKGSLIPCLSSCRVLSLQLLHTVRTSR